VRPLGGRRTPVFVDDMMARTIRSSSDTIILYCIGRRGGGNDGDGGCGGDDGVGRTVGDDGGGDMPPILPLKISMICIYRSVINS